MCDAGIEPMTTCATLILPTEVFTYLTFDLFMLCNNMNIQASLLLCSMSTFFADMALNILVHSINVFVQCVLSLGRISTLSTDMVPNILMHVFNVLFQFTFI